MTEERAMLLHGGARTVHPVTLTADRKLLYDEFHQGNTSDPADILRTVAFCKDLEGFIKTTVGENINNVRKRDIYYMNSLHPLKHLMFEEIKIALRNYRIVKCQLEKYCTSGWNDAVCWNRNELGIMSKMEHHEDRGTTAPNSRNTTHSNPPVPLLSNLPRFVGVGEATPMPARSINMAKRSSSKKRKDYDGSRTHREEDVEPADPTPASQTLSSAESLDRSTSAQAGLQEWVGTMVRKRFAPFGTFNGRVESITKGKYMRVAWEDGDSEDLNVKEATQASSLYSRWAIRSRVVNNDK
eukprot:GILJ01010328.1.p1 GENE.GILJ01010328.1~~GILJ01010328.1.p1  ORF type:complete len:350 (+),score=22.44 GILJ01010328.1:158-1051(+)